MIVDKIENQIGGRKIEFRVFFLKINLEKLFVLLGLDWSATTVKGVTLVPVFLNQFIIIVCSSDLSRTGFYAVWKNFA